jgi:hypothetical protein
MLKIFSLKFIFGSGFEELANKYLFAWIICDFFIGTLRNQSFLNIYRKVVLLIQCSLDPDIPHHNQITILNPVSTLHDEVLDEYNFYSKLLVKNCSVSLMIIEKYDCKVISYFILYLYIWKYAYLNENKIRTLNIP